MVRDMLCAPTINGTWNLSLSVHKPEASCCCNVTTATADLVRTPLPSPQDLAFVASMDKRISAAKRQLDRHLQQLLLESLAAGDWGPALHCLHGHVELGDPGRGEEALRSGLVRGVVREVVQEAKAAAGTGAGGVMQRFL